MKMITGILFLLLFGVVGLQLVRLSKERAFLAEKARELSDEVAGMREENEKVKSDLAYFSNPKNLAKEIRSLLNYKKAGEEVYIIVPKQTPP